ncbi:MAG: O-antigen ligase family protein, partial [Elusimicrobiaceae bacterium]|nr:O-antigen ligase family protein [Elusimicrobiaceae bacterium]
AKRMQSVNFRLSTWRSTWDMVQATPLTGTGLGSFQVIYQAYKRPDIFYMENLHNAETQHAENFFLEQWATLGILGLGLFLYLVFYQLKGAFKAFKYFEYTDDKETACNLLAALMASTAIYLHNLVDVSIYFVSTMYFLALFNGVLFNLGYGGLEKREKENKQDKKPGVLSYIICILASSFILFMVMFTGYKFVKIALSDNLFLLGLYWLFLLAGCLGVLCVFGYIIWKSKKIFVAIIMLLTAFLMFKAFGTLIADHYLSMASAMSMKKDPSTGIVYTKAMELNPFRTSINQFKASFFVNRFDMRKKYLPLEGDTEPMNDFERADKYYEKETTLSPNNALLWHNRGLLHKKMAVYIGQKDFLEGEKYYKQAEAYFKRSLHLDPVFDNTYFQLADIAATHRDFKTAKIWLDMYMKGPEDVVNEDYLALHKNNTTAKKFYKLFDDEEKKINEQNAK